MLRFTPTVRVPVPRSFVRAFKDGTMACSKNRHYLARPFLHGKVLEWAVREEDKPLTMINRKFSCYAAAFSYSFHPVTNKCTSSTESDMADKTGTRNALSRSLILLLLGSSGMYTIWSLVRTEGVEGDDGQKKKQKFTLSLSTLVSHLMSMSPFIVNAAKPLDSDVINTSSNLNINSSKKGDIIGRRQSFNFIADVLGIVQGAVVCIEVKDHSTTNWFGIPQGSSNGSGFIVKEDGLILTNAHVVASHQRNSITVRLHDGRCFPGYIEDVDYESDLATVRVKARGLPVLPLGCSSETRIGEWVLAVGSPLNLSNTVTTGVVSSTRRGATEIGIYENDINYIQTDAAITFGNSGGPLINLDGEAIGINSMKVTPGISFAIPIDHAKKFLQRAEMRRASGKSKASRRYMGVSILSLTDQIREELKSRTGICMVDHGVFVWQVVRGGPAYLSGIQPGDVITSINGKQIRSAAQVHEIVKSDDELQMEINRGGRKLIINMVPENVMQ